MSETTALDKQFFITLIFSLFRHLFTGVGLWFTTNNIGTEGQWELLLTGLSSLLVGTVLIVWSKHEERIKFLTGLKAKAGTTEKQVDKMIAGGHGVGQ